MKAETISVAPFRPDVLRFDEHVFVLRRRLATDVVQEEGSWIIRSDELDLTVWGESREEAEEAFAFAFYAHYLNYYLADDSQLTPDAQAYKQQLHELIQVALHLS